MKREETELLKMLFEKHREEFGKKETEKLLEDLMGKKGSLRRLKNFLKEYYGFTPTFTGIVFAGLTASATYLVGAVQQLSSQIPYLLETRDFLGILSSLYESGSYVSGKYIVPGFLVGQFLGYKIKKFLNSMLGRR